VSVTELAPPGGDFERTPPHDLAAEQCVLGGMLMSKDAISDVMEVIRPADHYRPAHQIIHEAILELYGRGEPADAVTVSDLLSKRGELGRVGGAPYLHTLVASVPTAANAGYYARIVRERAILRRLVAAGTRIVQLGYAGDGDADALVDRAEAEIYGVTERRVSEDYLPLSEIMPGTLDEIEAAGSRGGLMTGVPTGFADLDALTNGLHPGQMIVIAARPAIGKSTLALDLARAASVRHGLATVMFSLEMSRNEITMRLLSAESRVALHAMRTGQMSEEDWARLARRMSEVVDAPLYIDDSPNLSMMEIRAKSRRLKQRHDLRLVIVDYLQLMSSPRRVENRQQEVSEMSRSLKLLAKELNVPVVAVSQLNRGPEQRNDKRPLLSDLRESGCLTAATRILRADTGAEVSLGDLVASGRCGVPVWSLDERLRLVPRTMTAAFPSGVREVFRVRLRSGREVEATANHPFLTCDGWVALRGLAAGARVGVLWRVPAPLAARELPEPGVARLARLPGDGCWVLDRVAREVWERVGPVLAGQEVPACGLAAIGAQSRGATRREPAPGRSRLSQVAAVLGGGDLETLAVNDVFWDEILSVESLGEQPVYDATVPGTHNFVANGIIVHNSIEQDADVVILLHREDAYERESPRAGEADLIVAKHRNGPTTTVTVAFQGHYSRFVDMAPA
jgi:replicative DNA helicase